MSLNINLSTKEHRNSEYVDRDLPIIKNDTIIRAAKGETCSHIPVWLMRQAGRYLPEYLSFTKDKDFFSVCRNSAWACEVTLQPIIRYNLDAAIIFSDILVLPQALGWNFVMVPQQGPKCTNPLKTIENLGSFVETISGFLDLDSKNKVLSLYSSHDDQFISELQRNISFSLCDKIVANSLGYVCDAIHVTRKALSGRVPLIGFCGAPWTLFTYITEGGGSKLYSNAKRWLYAHTEFAHCIFGVLTGCIAAFLIRQIDAGASLVQVFESHGGELPKDMFEEFCTPYLAQIARTVKYHRPHVPIMLFCKGCVDHRLGGEQLYDVLSIDAKNSIADVAHHANGKFSVQGNFETAALHLPTGSLTAKIEQMIQNISDATSSLDKIPRRYIANLGHGVTPDIDPKAVEHFIETVHAFCNNKYKSLE
uniref:uroporphyrinogen decarboxylase n=1 Tax=Perkinsela sp. SMB-60 TaxID=1840652 RepID=A0A167HCX8_9EUGL|nr:uroporphyrinogen decarboxylase [Perkinsela sp. SMB-60]